jgi:hypothetical protein
MKNHIFLVVIFLAIYLMNCSNDVTKIRDENSGDDKAVADVVSVSVTGESNAYAFSVRIMSPDTGCEQYADWWEVLSEDGNLLYRRILAHSHVNEQPFTRSGQPVTIEATDIVFVRAHMHPGGYGGVVFKGSVEEGFEEVMVPPEFAQSIETEDPQPAGCAF